MKIAYIILAHRYPEQLIRLVFRLHTESTSFFIHINKRTDDKIYHQVVSGLSHLPNVYFLKRHPVAWGNFGHTNASLEGIKEVFAKNISFDWLFLLTGQDYPIKSNRQIENFLRENEGKVFLDYIDFQVPPDRGWATSGSDRIDYWHFSFLDQLRFVFPAQLTTNAYNRYVKSDRNWFSFAAFLWSVFIVFFPIKRKFPEGFIPFRGSSYWCFPKDCVEYIHNFIQQNRDFVNFFKYVDCPDEIFFQTLILNSRFKERVSTGNLHYIDWDNPNPSSPRVFVKTDFERLASSSKLLARKFDLTRDADIFDLIDKKILNDEK